MVGHPTRAELDLIIEQQIGARLSGRPRQEVYVASATQNYKLGSRRVMGAMGNAVDHRVWHYTQLATTTRTGGYGALTAGVGLFATSIPSGALTIVTAAIGARTVTVSAPTLVVNAYAGGLLTMYEAGQPVCILGIISNTATVITLDGPLPGTYTAAATAQVIPGPYHEVIIPGVSCTAGAVFEACVGVFNSPLDEAGNVAAAGDFAWIQTWGICNMWASGTYEGDLTGERDVYVLGDGNAQITTVLGSTTYIGMQRIGFLYPYTGPAADNVAEHAVIIGGQVTTLMNHAIFLQIAP